MVLITRFIVFLAAMFFLNAPALRAQPLERVANTTLIMPATPRQQGYTLQRAFTNAFNLPVVIASPPGETNRLFVVEQAGRIMVFTNLAQANPPLSIFLDIRTRVLDGGEQGLLGLAFHPNYRENGYFYVFYTTEDGLKDRLSRFTVSNVNSNLADASSELVLFSQVDEASNHNGGDLHFGPDGYLYVSLGDEGGANDGFANSQKINRDFFAGILRIDVDKRPGNLDPNPHPALTATNYFVPADNPFVGTNRFNGILLPDVTKVRTEFWAVGLRNPWRFSFDRVSGQLWCGDVGQDLHEEVDIITRGGNYGWNYREGLSPFGNATPPPGFTHINPVHDYPRSQGVSITGGVVYRGGAAVSAARGLSFCGLRLRPFLGVAAERPWPGQRPAIAHGHGHRRVRDRSRQSRCAGLRSRRRCHQTACLQRHRHRHAVAAHAGGDGRFL